MKQLTCMQTKVQCCQIGSHEREVNEIATVCALPNFTNKHVAIVSISKLSLNFETKML